jgi:hypothetical protein
MTRFEIVLGFLITAATACLLMAVIIAAKAQADGIPRGLGHPPGAPHWYEGACCNEKDCEPVEPEAIVETNRGYAVRYMSARGFLVEGFMARGDNWVRPSQDKMKHACATAQRLLCIYVHFGA